MEENCSKMDLLNELQAMSIMISSEPKSKNVNDILEKIFAKAAYDKFYDDWIRNFALNLENIWNGHSARDLMPKENKSYPGIVIGRGPSLEKHQHLKMLADSKYDGAIICCDGVLPQVLNSGVTPDKFKKFFVVTIDARYDIINFYNHPIVKKYGKDIKCVLSTTVPITTYEAIKNADVEIYWVHALFDYNKGQSSFNYISGLMTKSKNHKKGLPGIQTGGNVGTSSWVVSWSILKCNPVTLIGLDLGYPEETSWEEIKNYHEMPDYIETNSKSFKKAFPTVYNPDFKCYCKQDPKFQFYCNAFKEFIPKASKFVKTINATEGGSIFGDGIECMIFKKFLENQNAL